MKARIFRPLYLTAIVTAMFGWIWLLANIVEWFF
jgi:hypothetical protein